VRETRRRFPSVTPHYFTASEIQTVAQVSGLSMPEVLAALKAAGQTTLPGGGAEILSERVRRRIEPKKGGPSAWLDVHREAHRQGFRSTATMMYGHVETPDDVLDHLDAIRALQDEHGGFTAFVEGWGLYAESLGGELGFYKDPYSKFGQLTYEMWRAVRLVVDTGMHAKGWTRDQAIEFFKANAAKTENDIVNEIDRYIAWPGQAPSYLLGYEEILSLRAEAERRLGPGFDLRAFHDAVLGGGSATLPVLRARVEGWMASR